MNAAAGHVADHEPDPPFTHVEDVVPIASDLDAGAAGDEAGGEPHAGNLGEPLGHEASLQHVGSLSLRHVADRARHQETFVCRKRAEADLHGELRAVLAPAVEIEARTHRPCMRVREVAATFESVRASAA